MRQIVLDTETTGLEPAQGHRIIEIGCVELLKRRFTGNRFHCYLRPERPIDAGALAVHGITDEFLADKPRFGDIAEEFLAFIKDAELVIHNAAFDVGFIDQELKLLGDPWGTVADHAKVLCTLTLARALHPGQKNSLDGLCKRYAVDNAHREWHGALLDAELLAEVYLAMTGGQVSLLLEAAHERDELSPLRRLDPDRPRLPVICPTPEELAAHQVRLEAIGKVHECLWKKFE